ncbi:sugar phosphate isomerase/epimerase family protein [Saccharopolyspora mangrovi]|uniref:Sugar phosphate isomerase/epimerase n=1 Tax=Saccharopolyspora mangrovi TaxID=3082379 RepID=A0ABU6A4M6_9PSEU|nr:sugar phosphate isomerase/epimerase [Saccharopolyspora sp. S2-29]MEB3366506.1 sugar phosphate isomerase/epimerase [Saccharopolyspora sp. S2-29]
MPLKLGAYTACLHDRPLAEALDVLRAHGLTSAEVNTGGFLPAPHCPVDLLLSSERARADYLAAFAERGVELTGLNCNGNPLSPLPGTGAKHADDLRRTIELAGLLGIRTVVTMSGTPGSDPHAKYPSWVVNPWDGVQMDVLDYQWGVATEFWSEIDALARAHDVRVAIEMHPHNLVFSPITLEQLVERTGASNLGAEMDPSHLMWQGMDVVACIRHLGPLVLHAAAKDATLCPGIGVRGVLDTSFSRVPADAPAKVPTGIGTWCNTWPDDPAWKFVAVGLGHGIAYWTEFLAALAEVDPDMPVNIEHEDASYSQLEGLALAAKNLHAAAVDL